jgi:hypothetical protein
MDVTLIDPYRLKISGKEIEFPQRVKKFVSVGSRAIVLLKVSDFEEGDPMVGRNIVAIDEDGKMAWRIEDHGIKVKDWQGIEAPEAFFGLWLENNGKTLKAGVPHAIFEVDPETGRLLSIETVHR